MFWSDLLVVVVFFLTTVGEKNNINNSGLKKTEVTIGTKLRGKLGQTCGGGCMIVDIILDILLKDVGRNFLFFFFLYNLFYNHSKHANFSSELPSKYIFKLV